MLPQLLLVGCASDPHGLGRPNRLALGGGHVYVSDFQHDRIAEFDENGRFVRTFGEHGLGRDQLWRVTAMAVDADGSLLVANLHPASDAETDDSKVVEIKRFVDGREAERMDLGAQVIAQDEGWIDAVAPMGDGRLLVASSAQGELTVVRRGQLEGRFGGIPRPDASPTAIARVPDAPPEGAAFWEVEQMRHRVTPLDAHGQPLPFTPSTEAGALSFPSSVAVCPDGPDRAGFVVVADLGNLRVVRYATDGSLLGTFTPEPVAPDRPVQLLDLALSEDCQRLFLVDSKGDRVIVTDLEGHVLDQLSNW